MEPVQEKLTQTKYDSVCACVCNINIPAAQHPSTFRERERESERENGRGGEKNGLGTIQFFGSEESTDISSYATMPCMT